MSASLRRDPIALPLPIHAAARRAAMIRPPLPLPSAIVDPRVGDLGPALLALADGTVFPGIAFGAPLAAGGDLVVNTSQTGYQEVCTDPSYAGQVVAMTYPLIGNYGRLRDDDQSERPWLRALVVANATAAVVEPPRQLAALLRDDGIPAIAGVDTRALARHLRTTARSRAIVTAPGEVDPDAAVAAARALPRWEDQDFVDLVSPEAPREVGGRPRADRSSRSSTTGSRRTSSARSAGAGPACGSCRTRSIRRTRSPRTSTGWSCRPGPGDPSRLAGPVALARAAIADGRPLLGICLGHQIVGRAAGAETRRLRFGHHGANHPGPRRRHRPGPGHGPEPRGPGRRRHAPAAGGFHVSQVNLNDGSVEGLRHRELPIETVQYHPEGAPGPLDALAVFDRFVAACAARRTGHRVSATCGRAPARCSSSGRGRSSSARPPSSTTPAPRPAGRCGPRASGRSW